MDLRVSTQSVQAIAVRNMREAITSGFFRPGDRLVETEMCTMLGISRPSLREALRSLEAEKLITIVPNRGPIIPILTAEEARELYDVRMMLEPEACALSASRAPEASINAMREALRAFDVAVKSEDAASRIKATRSFYDQILSSCGHRLIEEMLNTLLARVTFLRMKSMSLAGRAEKSSQEMWAILKHISAGNPAGARTAAVRHVKKACEAAMLAYEKNEATS